MAKVRKKTTIKKMPKYRTEATGQTFGRPTKYEPEFCKQVIEFMAQGYSKEAVAGELGITKDTLYQWEKAHADFSDALKRGVELSRKFWEKVGIDHITHYAKGKQLNATAWIFNMKNRFSWSDKKEIELGEKAAKSFGFKLDVLPEAVDESPDTPEESAS